MFIRPCRRNKSTQNNGLALWLCPITSGEIPRNSFGASSNGRSFHLREGYAIARQFAQAFYHSPQWRAVRKQVLRRDQFTCRDCTGRATEVHHRIELTPMNINDPSIALNPDNLESLCWLCHDKRTKGCSDAGSGYAFDDDGQVIQTR